MQYEYEIGFPRARDALAAWCEITGEKIKIPSNCCPALLPFASEIVPIDPETGLAPVPVQLYGYRQIFPGSKLEIDPLLTGLFGKPFAESVIVSFGYAKTIDIGGGGAIYTNDKSLASELHKRESFPPFLREPLAKAVSRLHGTIMQKKRQYEEIEKTFSWLVKKFPTRPIIPWRFTGRIMEKKNAEAIYKTLPAYHLGRNYPALPGVTDKGAVQFGVEVINIWK